MSAPHILPVEEQRLADGRWRLVYPEDTRECPWHGLHRGPCPDCATDAAEIASAPTISITTGETK